ncbi:SDR family oxidoreductase [Pseudomonas sp.]|uniref:SDR family oxidoreductase n=1 Tax=Pseudomonas sp. TaxID=306 RepID=UPI00260A1AC9|nr:SDR family oxidoreductase [Pseudomonas sp.]
MTNVKRKILVTGATGNIGGALVRFLAADASLQVVAAARNPEKAASLGVPVVLFDYDREETLAPALDGVDSVFMLTGYTVDMLKQSHSFVNAAKKAGVKYIVHLGAPGDDDTKIGHWTWHQFVERFIEWSGISFTHLRPQLFMQNLLNYGGSDAKNNGSIRHYVGDANISWVDTNDVAAVAAVALRHPENHEGKTYHLGYEAKSYSEIADVLTKVIGQKFTAESRPPKEFLDEMLAAGAEPAYMSCVHQNWVDYEARAIPGADAVYDNFFALTGRQPKTWAEFAKENAAAFKY